MSLETKKYIPPLRPMLLYGWCTILIIAPLFFQLVFYILTCLLCKHCFYTFAPWATTFIIFLPALYLMHWTIKKIINEEAKNLKSAIEMNNSFTHSTSLISNFYNFPDRILFFSIPIVIVILLPLALHAYRDMSKLIGICFILIPFMTHFLLFVIFKVITYRIISKAGQFIPLTEKSRRHSPDTRIGNLLFQVSLFTSTGFVIITYFLFFLSIKNWALSWNVLTIFLIAGLIIAVAFSFGFLLIGKRIGKNLREIASQIDALGSVPDDKTVSSLKVFPESYCLIGEIRHIKELTKGIVAKIAETRMLQKEAIQMAMQNQRMKTMFLASMSHDLKSPLNSIIGFSELLLKGIEGELNDEQREDIQIINDSGEELLSLINDILDFARLESNTLEIHKEWTPPVEFITDAVKKSNPLIRKKPVNIQTEIQPGLPPVFVDPVRMSQVINRLISNAINFMEKGSVVVKTYLDRGLNEENDKYLRVDVITQGTGVKSKEFEKIFDSFALMKEGELEQSSISTKVGKEHKAPLNNIFWKEAGGIGLSLSLSRSLIMLHGGKVWMTKDGEKESIFSIGIPIKPS